MTASKKLIAISSWTNTHYRILPTLSFKVNAISHLISSHPPPLPHRFSTTFADTAVVNLVRLRIFESEFFSRKKRSFFFFLQRVNLLMLLEDVITYNYIYVAFNIRIFFQKKEILFFFFFFDKE